MSKDDDPIFEGYQPMEIIRVQGGYQPQIVIPDPPRPEGGYVPTGQGSDITSTPQPPDSE